MFGALMSLASGAASWLGSAAGAVTSAVTGFLKSPAGKGVISAAASAIAGDKKKAHFSKTSISKPAPKLPVRSESKEKSNTMLYVALGGVALIALVLFLKK